MPLSNEQNLNPIEIKIYITNSKTDIRYSKLIGNKYNIVYILSSYNIV